MGFFKNVFGSKEIVVDPEDLTLPDEIPTNQPGLSLKKGAAGTEVEIEIVGESFRAANVAAVAKAAEGKRFDIYLINEPTNQYDKNAVAVFAANLHIGYIGKPANKQWFKWVNEATERKELLWGTARAVSREGAANTGIFGSIYMPKAGQDMGDLIPMQMKDTEIQKAAKKVIAFSNTTQEPETLAKVRSTTKKAVATIAPLAAHAKWVQANPEGQDTSLWDEVADLCDQIYDNASEAAYATDAFDVDALGSVQELAELLHKHFPES